MAGPLKSGPGPRRGPGARLRRQSQPRIDVVQLRAPYYVQIYRRNWQQADQQPNTLLTLLAPATVSPPPFTPSYDLPPSRPFPMDLRTWVQGLSPIESPGNAFIANPEIYDLPPRSAAYPNDLRTWTQGSPILLSATPTPPPPSYDWPLPQVAARDNSLRSWISVFPLPLNGGDRPPVIYDFSVPKAPQRANELSTWVQNLLETTLAPVIQPFTQTDWPVPAQRPRGDFSFTESTPLTLLAPPAASPPVSYGNSPVPIPQIYPVGLRTWINTFPLPFFGGAQPPFLYDYPNPRGAVYPMDLRTVGLDLLQSTLRPTPPAISLIIIINE